MNPNKGILFTVSGPSGVGKGTVLDHVLKEDGNLQFSVSVTTRKPREGEIEGVHYFFKTKTQFEAMINAGEFLEWAFVHDNYYGTPKNAAEEVLNKGIDLILDIDVQGGRQVMQSRPQSTFIFIAPPQMDISVLKERLQRRKTENIMQIERRLKTAEEELKQAHFYEYIVFNDVIQKAVQDLKSIIGAERCKTIRYSLY